MNPKDFIEHVGILGMRWGRRSGGSDADKSKKKVEKKLKYADKAWEKNRKKHISIALENLSKNKQYNKEAVNIAAKLVKAGLIENELNNAFQRQIAPVITKHLLADKEAYNPSRTKVIVMAPIRINGSVYLTPKIAEVDMSSKSMEAKHTMDSKDFIEHVGILGMRWGRRSGGSSGNSESFRTKHLKRASAATDKEINWLKEAKKGVKNSPKDLKLLNNMIKGLSSVNTFTKQKLKTSHASDHPDSVKKDQLRTKKAKHLSNDELKTAITRMQLERQYKDLSKSDGFLGKKFVTDFVVSTSKQVVSSVVSKKLKI